jgi:hypothetical protein
MGDYHTGIQEFQRMRHLYSIFKGFYTGIIGYEQGGVRKIIKDIGSDFFLRA